MDKTKIKGVREYLYDWPACQCRGRTECTTPVRLMTLYPCPKTWRRLDLAFAPPPNLFAFVRSVAFARSVVRSVVPPPNLFAFVRSVVPPLNLVVSVSFALDFVPLSLSLALAFALALVLGYLRF